MDSKVSLLSPFNYVFWKPNMSAYLKRLCLFDVSIGALSEPQYYEENIDWINNFDRDYGIMCVTYPNFVKLCNLLYYILRHYVKLNPK